MYINPDPCSIKSVRKEILTCSLLRSPICSVLIAATIATGSVLEARKQNLSAKPDFGRNPTGLLGFSYGVIGLTVFFLQRFCIGN